MTKLSVPALLLAVVMLFLPLNLYAGWHHHSDNHQETNDSQVENVEGIEAIFCDVSGIVLQMQGNDLDENYAKMQSENWQPLVCRKFENQCHYRSHGNHCRKLEKQCEKAKAGFVWLEFEEEVNLIEFQHELPELLAQFDLDAGNYSKIILLAKNRRPLEIQIDGESYNLKIHHSFKRGIVFEQDFTIDEDGEAEFEKDFAIENSVSVDKCGKYHLTPWIELVDKQTEPEPQPQPDPVVEPEASIYGSISGIVTPEGTIVYVFLFNEGGYDPASVDPFSSAVTAVQPDENSEFIFAELVPGTYEIVVRNFTNSHVFTLRDIVVEANETADVGVIDVGN